MLTRLTFTALIALPLSFASTPAPACGIQPLIGSICAFAGNFTPRGYVPADGRLLVISENLALFSLLGNMYGGDGVTTFALPDLRGRAPTGMGQGPGLSPYEQGQTGGAESITLDVSQLPAHTHAAAVTTTATQTVGNTNMPEGAVWATDERDDNYYTGQVPNPVKMASDAVEVVVGSAGQSKPIDNRQPYLAVRWLIALQGVFPSRE
ncbi:phage tail protein [Denitrobaculum tricleocarpae]|uniref:phage tail protein n=1 Tax=Denitrobaculum tricleocarpae TaxID=2591009 RepID=UPI001C5519B8|nr:tail fiber protein [Denitrobaculum tricleocarpae]